MLVIRNHKFTFKELHMKALNLHPATWLTIIIMVYFGFSVIFTSKVANSGQSSPDEITRDTLLAASLSKKADHYSKSGRIDSAIILYSNVASIFTKHNLKAEYASTLLYLSDQFSLAGQGGEAQKYAREAFGIAEKLNNLKIRARALSNLGAVAANSGKPDSALYLFSQAVEIGTPEFGEKTYFISDCYGNIGICYMLKQDLLKSLIYLKRAVDLFPVGTGVPEDNLHFFYYYLGMIYQQLSNQEEAIRYYKMFYDYYYPKYGDGHPLMAGIYNNLAEIYKLTGKLEDASIYMQRARLLLEATRGRNDPLWVNATNNMAGIYSETGHYRDALTLMFIVKDFYYRRENPPYEYALALNSLGHIYQKMGKYDSAEYYFLQGLKVTGTDPERQELACNIYSNMGTMYAQQDQYRKAIDILNLALRQFGNSENISRVIHARLYYNLGYMYTDIGQVEHALSCLQRSMACNVRDFSDTNRYSNPVLSGISDIGLLIRTLTAKAAAWRKSYYSIGHCDPESMKAAFESAYLAVQAIDSLKSYRSSSVPEFKHFEGLPYKTGIETAFLLYHITGDRSYLEKTFEMSEKSKYYTLYQSFNELNARNIGGIPDSLQDKERLLRMQLGNVTKALEQENMKPGPDTEKIKLLSQKQFLMKARSDSLIRFFEHHYPSYYSLKYDRKVATVEQVMQKLKPGQALVEYATGTDRTVIFVITPLTSTMVSVTDKGLSERADELRSVIRQRDVSGKGRAAYCKVAGNLYDLLLAPVGPLIKGRRLTIIPDGKLGTIPFEALLNTRDTSGFKNWATLPYLTREFSIGYGYSATLYLGSLQMKDNRAPRKEILGFAPIFGNNQHLLAELQERGTEFTELAGARNEVIHLAKEYGGKIFLDTAATLQNFLSFAPEHNILHISTHGILNDENPLESKLVFFQKNDSANADLYLHQLFTMKFSANLAVLSACNTGYGRLADGEGMISLSGAFMYTGVSSLISTLWSVNDQSTASVIRSFYHYLYERKIKPEALRLARLEYLDNADNLMAHPYYWAGFISIGNDQPLPGFRFLRLAIIAGGIILILLIAGGVIRLLKHKA